MLIALHIIPKNDFTQKYKIIFMIINLTNKLSEISQM